MKERTSCRYGCRWSWWSWSASADAGGAGGAGAPPADAGAPPAGGEPGADTQEMDITDLVNMTKSIKKQLDDTQGKDTGGTQKMDDIFTKLNDLEAKLGEMDSVIA